jgi:hypothetical protein
MLSSFWVLFPHCALLASEVKESDPRRHSRIG